MTRGRTTRDDVVEDLRTFADNLDGEGMTAGKAANETRRLARQLECEAPGRGVRTDGGTVGRARAFGAAGINFSERAVSNVLVVVSALLWMAAGADMASSFIPTTGVAAMLGAVVTLAVAFRFRRWSA